MTTVEAAVANSKADMIFDAVWPNTLGCKLELGWEEARQFIRRIDQYNDFDHEKVLHALDLIDAAMPRMSYGNMPDGRPNPNNDKRNFTIEVGRERSPVIYLELYELHSYGNPTVPMTPEKVEYIKSVMHEVGMADEYDCDVQDYRKHGMGIRYTFRFWWD